MFSYDRSCFNLFVKCGAKPAFYRKITKTIIVNMVKPGRGLQGLHLIDGGRHQIGLRNSRRLRLFHHGPGAPSQSQTQGKIYQG